MLFGGTQTVGGFSYHSGISSMYEGNLVEKDDHEERLGETKKKLEASLFSALCSGILFSCFLF
jgi:hypothetical protein